MVESVASEDTKALICVIDDDDAVRQTICRILTGAGHAVVEARDGRMGLKVIEHAHPTMIITDIVMPNREGIETIMEVKQRFPNIPILAISGGGRMEPNGFLDLAGKLGADDCLAKPFRPPELLRKVDALLHPLEEARRIA
ncbi:MAG TPA: response regulator [Rhizomicrobium sp.]|nr:response regulator [Rhizomicrobium sp.]